METLKFKTNINCGGCIEKVTPFLNGEEHIKSWKVDTANPQKILTIETDDYSNDQLISLLDKAGYKAEPISGEAV